jgi:hypothetical protein
MLKILYLPTGQMVGCPGEYAYTREDFERYIYREPVWFGYRNSNPDHILWLGAGLLNEPFTVIPKHLLQLVELDDVPNRVSPNK